MMMCVVGRDVRMWCAVAYPMPELAPVINQVCVEDMLKQTKIGNGCQKEDRRDGFGVSIRLVLLPVRFLALALSTRQNRARFTLLQYNTITTCFFVFMYKIEPFCVF